MSSRTLVVCALSMLLACGCSKTADKPTNAKAPPSAGGVAPTIGDVPTFAVSLWPQHWSAVPGIIEQHAPELAPLVREDATNMWTAATLALRMAGLRSVTLPLTGMDEGAPIHIAVYPPTQTFESVALATALGTSIEPAGRTPLLYVTLSAADPQVLTASVAAALKGTQRGSLIVGRFGVARITADKTTVTLAVAIDESLDAGTDAQLSQTLGAPRTAGLAFHVPTASAVRVAARIHGLPSMGTVSGAMNVYRAIADAGADMKDLMLAVGTSELLSAYLLMDPGTTFAHAMYIDVEARSKDALHIAQDLSPSAASTMRAAGVGAKPVPVETLDVEKAAAQVAVSPLVGSLKTTNDVARVVHECGWGCMVYMGFGNAVQMLPAAASDGSVPSLSEAFKVPGSTGWAPNAALQDTRLFLSPGAVDIGHWMGLRAAPRAQPSKSETCYRQALVDVRQGLRSVGELEPAQRVVGIQQAQLALAKHKVCVTGNAAIAARYAEMVKLVDYLASKATSANVPR